MNDDKFRVVVQFDRLFENRRLNVGRTSQWCPYHRYDRYSSKRIQRSERLYGNRALSDRSIAVIAEIENVLFQRSRSLSARFPYNRSDRGVFLSYRSDPSDYMDTRLKI